MTSTLEAAIRYAAYGALAEGLFTGATNYFATGDPTLPCHTQLWVFPLYGLGGVFGFEKLHYLVRHRPAVVRAACYALMVFAIEYSGGWIALRLTGQVPWEYEENILTVHKLIHLGYAPIWGSLCLVAERVQRSMGRLHPKPR